MEAAIRSPRKGGKRNMTLRRMMRVFRTMEAVSMTKRTLPMLITTSTVKRKRK